MIKVECSIDTTVIRAAVNEGSDFNDDLVMDDGQVCRKISTENRFCSLDYIAETPSDYGDPERLAMKHEEDMGVPLALEDHFSPMMFALQLMLKTQ